MSMIIMDNDIWWWARPDVYNRVCVWWINRALPSTFLQSLRCLTRSSGFTTYSSSSNWIERTRMPEGSRGCPPHVIGLRDLNTISMKMSRHFSFRCRWGSWRRILWRQYANISHEWFRFSFAFNSFASLLMLWIIDGGVNENKTCE